MDLVLRADEMLSGVLRKATKRARGHDVRKDRLDSCNRHLSCAFTSILLLELTKNKLEQHVLEQLSGPAVAASSPPPSSATATARVSAAAWWIWFPRARCGGVRQITHLSHTVEAERSFSRIDLGEISFVTNWCRID